MIISMWEQVEKSISYALNEPAYIDKINLWHFLGDSRRYHDVVVQLANKSDFSDAFNVYNNDTDNSLGLGRGYRFRISRIFKW